MNAKKLISLLRPNESYQKTLERIRLHFDLKEDMINIVNFLNEMSKKYTYSNIKYELYLLLLSYSILPTSYSTCSIGEIYINGIKNNKKLNRENNIIRNNSKGISYLIFSSTFGNSRANYLLGMIYLRKKQYIESIYYLKLSASKCNSDALYQLGIIYFSRENNFRIPNNFHLAYKYFSHSALHNNDLAHLILKNFGESIKSQYIDQRINEMIIIGMKWRNNEYCPICFECVNGYILPCNTPHFICKTCITKLLENEILRDGEITCPLCRKKYN